MKLYIGTSNIYVIKMYVLEMSNMSSLLVLYSLVMAVSS